MYVEPLFVEAEPVADFPIDEDRLLVRRPPALLPVDRLLAPEFTIEVTFDCVGSTSLDFEPLPTDPIFTDDDIDPPLIVDIGVDVERGFDSNFPGKPVYDGGLWLEVPVNGIDDVWVKVVLLPSAAAAEFQVVDSIDIGDPCFCPDNGLARFRLRSSSGSYEARFQVGLRFRVECGRGSSYAVEETECGDDRRRLLEAGGDAAGTSVTTYCL
jgi:hypothetical protein